LIERRQGRLAPSLSALLEMLPALRGRHRLLPSNRSGPACGPYRPVELLPVENALPRAAIALVGG